jgi:Domain of unknown function (DUF4170)
MTKTPAKPAKQLVHMVVGGELTDLKKAEFKDLTKLDVVGFYPNFAEAQKAWLGKARETIDNAQMRYFIVHLHRLLDPATDATKKKPAKRK